MHALQTDHMDDIRRHQGGLDYAYTRGCTDTGTPGNYFLRCDVIGMCACVGGVNNWRGVRVRVHTAEQHSTRT